MLFLELLNSPIFHLFSDLYIGSKSINAFTTITVLSTIYNKTLQSHEPSYLHNLLHVQSNTATRSSATVTLKRPTIHSRLKVTDRSFTHYAPVLWNRLPKEFRQPAIHSPHTNQSVSTTTLLALSSSQFHSKLKTHLFRQSFPPYSVAYLHGRLFWFIDLASLLFISQSFSLYHSHSLRSHCITAQYWYTVSRNKPPSSHSCFGWFFVGTLNLLTHSTVIISFHAHYLFIISSYFM